MNELMASLVLYARSRPHSAPDTIRQTHVGKASLWLGDSAELLPQIVGADAIITDPPPGFAPAWVCCGRDGVRLRHCRDELANVIAAHPEWEVILDPFMGPRCAAGVAALSAGRRFIGIEIDPQAYAAAVEQLHRF